MWIPLENRRFRATSDDEGGFTPIPPFIFPIAFYSRLLIETYSSDAAQTFWQAGWINLIEQNSNLPTFTAIAYWRRVPLGASVLDLPSTGFYQVSIEPQPYFSTFTLKVWAK